ncbi:MAG: hypothetical protein WCX69_00540 [Candidatus Paceibacterota bacterium]
MSENPPGESFIEITEALIILNLVRDYHKAIVLPTYAEETPDKEINEQFSARIEKIINDSGSNDKTTFKFYWETVLDAAFVGIYYALLKSMKMDFADREQSLAKVINGGEENQALQASAKNTEISLYV